MQLFREHPRSWRENLYVYPVISRRSRGLSIGINLNPDKSCNFDCLYCCVDRTVPPAVRKVDLAVVRAELDHLLGLAVSGRLFEAPPFDQTPPALRRLNDIAFSGDGEPTAYPRLPEACRLVNDLLHLHGQAGQAKIVLITNATLLDRRPVAEAIAYLDTHHGEVWAKLDAGTAGYYQQVVRTKVPFERVLSNITQLACARPIVIQSLFLKTNGQGPPKREIDAYIDRLQAIIAAGGRIAAVQVYTVARRVADPSASALEASVLEEIGARVRAAGLAAEVFHAPE